MQLNESVKSNYDVVVCRVAGSNSFVVKYSKLENIVEGGMYSKEILDSAGKVLIMESING